MNTRDIVNGLVAIKVVLNPREVLREMAKQTELEKQAHISNDAQTKYDHNKYVAQQPKYSNMPNQTHHSAPRRGR